MGLLETRGLSKHFGGLRAVSNLDIDIEPGTIHGLIRIDFRYGQCITIRSTPHAC